MAATVHQQSLFKTWAALADINFTIDPAKSLKAEFTRLAKAGGWLSHNDIDVWCARWRQCFGEDYIWRGGTRAKSSDATQPSACPASTLSDSDGGVILTPPASEYDDSDDANRLNQPGPRGRGLEAYYPGFVDNASGLQEAFTKLAIHQGWGPKAKRTQRPKVYLRVAGHIFPEGADDTSTLKLWQALCKDVGLEYVPPSITKCKKALKSLHVNLIDLLDALAHDKPVHHFKSHKALAEYTRNGHAFPREAAKKEGFINSLLRKVI